MSEFITFSAQDRQVICAKTRDEWLSTCQAMRHAYKNCRPDVPYQAVWLLGTGALPSKEYWQEVRRRITRMRMDARETELEWIAHRREYMRKYMRNKRLQATQVNSNAPEDTVV